MRESEEWRKELMQAAEGCQADAAVLLRKHLWPNKCKCGNMLRAYPARLKQYESWEKKQEELMPLKFREIPQRLVICKRKCVGAKVDLMIFNKISKEPINEGIC